MSVINSQGDSLNAPCEISGDAQEGGSGTWLVLCYLVKKVERFDKDIPLRAECSKVSCTLHFAQ